MKNCINQKNLNSLVVSIKFIHKVQLIRINFQRISHLSDTTKLHFSYSNSLFKNIQVVRTVLPNYLNKHKYNIKRQEQKVHIHISTLKLIQSYKIKTKKKTSLKLG